MPDRITLDDALTSNTQQPTSRITFDEAVGAREVATAEYQAQKQREYEAMGTIPERDLGFNPLVTGERPAVMPNLEQMRPRIKGGDISSFPASFKAGFIADQDTARNEIAKSLKIDPKRVGFVDGNPVYVDDKGELRRVTSGLAGRTGAVAAASPEIIGGAVGSLAEGNPITGSATGAMGGAAAKRGLSGLMFGEPVRPAGVATEMAKEGAAALVGAGAGKLLAKGLDRGRVVDFTPSQIKTAEQARKLIKDRTGIDLDLAQASGDRTLLALRDFAARYPGKTAAMLQAQDEIAAGQFDSATRRVLDLVSDAAPSGKAGADAINAAQATIAGARSGVYAKVRPLYEQAYAAVPEVTDAKILNFLKLPYFSGAFKKGQKIAELEGVALPKDAAPDLRALDYTKRALDDNIDTLKAAGKRQEARALQMKRDEFVGMIDALPNQQWQLARQTYAQGIAANVTPLENGLVGVLAKMHPKNAASAARIFSDPNITPEQIAVLKGGLSKQNPDAYRGLVRSWLAGKYNGAMRETQGGDVINPAGKFRQAVIGTPGDRDKARAMLPADAADAFDDLMQAADKLASTPLGASRVAGSNTARDLNITETLKGRAMANLRWLLQPRQTAIQDAERQAMNDGVAALTEALIDPAKRAQLRQIARMKDSTRQAILLGGLLSGQASADEADDLTGQNALPEAMR